MQTLKSINFVDVKETKEYFVVIEYYERYSGGGVRAFKCTGKELLKKISKHFDYKGYLLDLLDDEDYKRNFKSFLKEAQSMNGDGWDHYSIYNI